MKAISLWQPWATLIARGHKAIETRSWAPPDHLIGSGEWLAIHATQRTPPGALNTAWGITHIVNALAHCGVTRFSATGGPGSLPTCAIVAVCQIRDVLTTEEMLGTWRTHRVGNVWNYHDEREYAFGDYDPGRYAWRLQNVIDLNDEPIQGVLGHQRVWNLDAATKAKLDERIRDRAARATGHVKATDPLRIYATGAIHS